ncbi:unnamed protein product [Withania somnifera]
MGHPLKLLVADLITSLQPTLVVFHRYHEKKNMEYYAEKVPLYDMVIINEDGEVDMMIKGRSKKNIKSPEASIATKPMISGQIINFFKPKCVNA